MDRRPVVLVADTVLPTLRLIASVLDDELAARVVPLSGPDELVRQVHEVRAALIVFELDGRRVGDIDALRRVRAVAPHTPVIALVVESPIMSCELVAQAGADVCLSKPFDLDELLAATRAHLLRCAPAGSRASRRRPAAGRRVPGALRAGRGGAGRSES